MKITASHDELKISNKLTLHNTTPSIFNKLLQKNVEENKESLIQKSSNTSKDLEKFSEKIKKATTAINEQENISLAPDTSNTHGELSLMLELKKLIAS